ncbi:MAG TPA: EF-P lysine aminoacylase EpmA [Exilispira sp.]|nr:EF-P lysine aminoacylase EpmA [Exilispira sp.]
MVLRNENNEEILIEKERFILQRKIPIAKIRMNFLQVLRNYFSSQGFLEVETPIRIRFPAPEANIETFKSEEKFLIASPEIQMKLLIMAGYEKIFQITHCFRKESTSNLHQTEFSMCEWYQVGCSIYDLMKDCENLIKSEIDFISSYLEKNETYEVDKKNCDDFFNRIKFPFEKIEIKDIYKELAGWDPTEEYNPEKFDIDMVSKIEPYLKTKAAVFLVGYPYYQASLARLRNGTEKIAERFELYLNGVEIANAFDELTDGYEQEKRFLEELKIRKEKGMNEYKIDKRFIENLKKGMKQTSGIALGVDRLLMVLLCKNSINDVILFPEGSF